MKTDEDLRDIDPDVVLITEYLAGRLSEFERFAVDKRLEEDEAFFEKVWPLMRAWRMPTAGLPVASTTTSISSDVALLLSAMKFVAEIRASSQPTVRQASLARCGSRSTMTGTSRPGVCGTCDRNIEPNLPAPISATRTGLPAARRALRRWERFIEDYPIEPSFRGDAFASGPNSMHTTGVWIPGSRFASPGMTRKYDYSAACRGARASRTSASSATVSIGVKSRWAM